MNGLKALSLWTQLGISLAGPIVLGALAGRWLDDKFGTDKIFFIILLVLGVAVGVSGAYGMVRELIKTEDGNKNKR